MSAAYFLERFPEFFGAAFSSTEEAVLVFSEWAKEHEADVGTPDTPDDTTLRWALWIFGAKLARAGLAAPDNGIHDLSGCESLKCLLHFKDSLAADTGATMVLSVFGQSMRPLLEPDALDSLLDHADISGDDAVLLHDSVFSDPIPPVSDWADAATRILLDIRPPAFGTASNFAKCVAKLYADAGKSAVFFRLIDDTDIFSPSKTVLPGIYPISSPVVPHFRVHGGTRMEHLWSALDASPDSGDAVRHLVFSAHFLVHNTFMLRKNTIGSHAHKEMEKFIDAASDFLETSAIGDAVATFRGVYDATISEFIGDLFTLTDIVQTVPANSAEWSLQSGFGFLPINEGASAPLFGPVVAHKMALFFEKSADPSGELDVQPVCAAGFIRYLLSGGSDGKGTAVSDKLGLSVDDKANLSRLSKGITGNLQLVDSLVYKRLFALVHDTSRLSTTTGDMSLGNCLNRSIRRWFETLARAFELDADLSAISAFSRQPLPGKSGVQYPWATAPSPLRQGSMFATSLELSDAPWVAGTALGVASFMVEAVSFGYLIAAYLFLKFLQEIRRVTAVVDKNVPKMTGVGRAVRWAARKARIHQLEPWIDDMLEKLCLTFQMACVVGFSISSVDFMSELVSNAISTVSDTVLSYFWGAVLNGASQAGFQATASFFLQSLVNMIMVTFFRKIAAYVIPTVSKMVNLNTKNFQAGMLMNGLYMLASVASIYATTDLVNNGGAGAADGWQGWLHGATLVGAVVNIAGIVAKWGVVPGATGWILKTAGAISAAIAVAPTKVLLVALGAAIVAASYAGVNKSKSQLATEKMIEDIKKVLKRYALESHLFRALSLATPAYLLVLSDLVVKLDTATTRAQRSSIVGIVAGVGTYRTAGPWALAFGGGAAATTYLFTKNNTTGYVRSLQCTAISLGLTGLIFHALGLYENFAYEAVSAAETSPELFERARREHTETYVGFPLSFLNSMLLKTTMRNFGLGNSYFATFTLLYESVGFVLSNYAVFPKGSYDSDGPYFKRLVKKIANVIKEWPKYEPTFIALVDQFAQKLQTAHPNSEGWTKTETAYFKNVAKNFAGTVWRNYFVPQYYPRYRDSLEDAIGSMYRDSIGWVSDAMFDQQYMPIVVRDINGTIFDIPNISSRPIEVNPSSWPFVVELSLGSQEAIPTSKITVFQMFTFVLETIAQPQNRRLPLYSSVFSKDQQTKVLRAFNEGELPAGSADSLGKRGTAVANVVFAHVNAEVRTPTVYNFFQGLSDDARRRQMVWVSFSDYQKSPATFFPEIYPDADASAGKGGAGAEEAAAIQRLRNSPIFILSTTPDFDLPSPLAPSDRDTVSGRLGALKKSVGKFVPDNVRAIVYYAVLFMVRYQYEKHLTAYAGTKLEDVEFIEGEGVETSVSDGISGHTFTFFSQSARAVPKDVGWPWESTSDGLGGEKGVEKDVKRLIGQIGLGAQDPDSVAEFNSAIAAVALTTWIQGTRK